MTNRLRKRWRYDLKGQTFGDLSVIALHGKSQNGHLRWLCQCKCGAKPVVFSGNLRRGASKQCRKCAVAAIGKARRKAPPEHVSELLRDVKQIEIAARFDCTPAAPAGSRASSA